jgi:hypothetical protein
MTAVSSIFTGSALVNNSLVVQFGCSLDIAFIPFRSIMNAPEMHHGLHPWPLS